MDFGSNGCLACHLEAFLKLSMTKQVDQNCAKAYNPLHFPNCPAKEVLRSDWKVRMKKSNSLPSTSHYDTNYGHFRALHTNPSRSLRRRYWTK